MHIGETTAIHQDAAAKIAQAVGEYDAVEMNILTEDVAIDPLERRGQVNTLQTGVPHEGFVTDVAQTFGQGDMFERATIVERQHDYAVEPFVEGHRLQSTAVVEGSRAEQSDAGRDVYRLQRSADLETTVWDAGHTVGNVDRLHGVAAGKGIAAESGDGGRQHHGGHPATHVEGFVIHGGDSVHRAEVGYRVGNHDGPRRLGVADPAGSVAVVCADGVSRRHHGSVAQRVDDIVERIALMGIGEDLGDVPEQAPVGMLAVGRGSPLGYEEVGVVVVQDTVGCGRGGWHAATEHQLVHLRVAVEGVGADAVEAGGQDQLAQARAIDKG